jgi:hypothetical protein
MTIPKRPELLMLPSKHGKRSTYTHRGCRCEDCRAAHAQYQRGLRARQAAAKKAAAA